jgi:hypothetical protein
MNEDFRIAAMQDSAVLLIYSMREQIWTDPPYQRMSDVWNLDKRQLLIDSLLNGFDIPKLYFHEFMPVKKEGKRITKYAIVDGKQRLETIWKFIDGDFPLASDFTLFADEKVKAGGMTYADLSKKYPALKLKFDSRTLPIITIQTEDIEMIEEMFSRLNEAVPLNAAEKRNAWGGPLPEVIRNLAKNTFFLRSVPFENKRYKHLDIATKFLLIEHEDKITDTKKEYLDALVLRYRQKSQKSAERLAEKCEPTLQAMVKLFTKDDPLLRAIGMITVYYCLFRQAIEEKWVKDLDHAMFQEFEASRAENRTLAEEDITNADYDMLEFDRLSQSPNDQQSIKFRARVLTHFLIAQIKDQKKRDD